MVGYKRHWPLILAVLLFTPRHSSLTRFFADHSCFLRPKRGKNSFNVLFTEERKGTYENMFKCLYLKTVKKR